MNIWQKIARLFGAQYVFYNHASESRTGQWTVTRVYIIQGMPYLQDHLHKNGSTDRVQKGYTMLAPEDLNTKWKPFTKRVAALCIMIADIPEAESGRSDGEAQCAAPQSPDARYQSFSPDDGYP